VLSAILHLRLRWGGVSKGVFPDLLQSHKPAQRPYHQPETDLSGTLLQETLSTFLAQFISYRKLSLAFQLGLHIFRLNSKKEKKKSGGSRKTSSRKCVHIIRTRNYVQECAEVEGK
jgi:hypothetical protein